MSKFPDRFTLARFGAIALLAGGQILAAGSMIGAAYAQTATSPGKFGLGRAALPEEIAAWDLDVRPDGKGLPAGSGSVAAGEVLFEDNCAVCHGSFAEGVDNWPKLAGGGGTLANADPVKTVGSYWPYLSTVWDYVNRSMPFGNAQSLEPDEVYAIVAYILYSNDLVDDDFVLSNQNFLDIELPNADGFILDNRVETEHAIWSGEPCMADCKDSVEITMRARVLDVTPEADGAEPAESPVAAADAGEPDAGEPAAVDPELIAAGEKVFKKCKACHQVGDGATNKVGPVLNGIVGNPAGAVEGFKYSRSLADAAADGLVWTPEELTGFLADPKGYLKGTKMSFRGLTKDKDLTAILAYLAAQE